MACDQETKRRTHPLPHIGAKLRCNRFENNSLVFINTVLQRGVYGPPISKTVSTVSFGARKTVKTVEKYIAPDNTDLNHGVNDSGLSTCCCMVYGLIWRLCATADGTDGQGCAGAIC